ncbi:IPT/TIG domain-containing protein, partial [Patescibacteria group bacterium]|nr:IPT/TIG domain-containing protein [Patescibacteria group bacterium]
MQNLINSMTKLFHPDNRKWTVPLTVLIAVAIVVGGVYYGGYLKDVFKGAKAASSLTVNFNYPDEYTSTPGFTMASGYVTVDAEFTKTGETQFSTTPNVTDLHSWPSLGITLAAVDSDQTVAYSVDNGETWAPFTLTSDIRIKKLAESGGVDGRVFGLGRTAGPDPANEIGAIVHSLLVSGELNELGYIPLPDTYSVNAGIQKTPSGRLYAGVTPRLPSATSVAIYSADGALGTPFSYVIPNVTSVNSFLQVNNRVYATASKNSANITAGEALVYYKDNDDASNWIPATLSGTTNHTATRGMAKDLQGYVYVITNAGYIMKSQTPGGTPGSDVFDQIDAPVTDGMRFVYLDGVTNNIWIPLTNGKLLRSVNGIEFFEVNTGIDLGPATSVVVTDAVELSDGQTLWSGGFWQSGSPYSGAVWFANAANNQTIANIMTVPFINLSSFSTVAVNGNFNYRISNTSDTPQSWYWVDSNGDWAESNVLTESSNALEINNNISKFSTQVGSGDLFVQAIFYRSAVPVGFSSPILDSVTIEYDELPVPTITSIYPSHGQPDGDTLVTIFGTNFGDSVTFQSSVQFGGINANSIISWSDTMIVVTSPAGIPATGVLVTVTNVNGTSIGVPYLYDELPAPTITSIDPQWGDQTGGTLVDIYGTGFVIGAVVLFDTSFATDIAVESSTHITANTPAHGEGLVDVRVINPDDQPGVLTDGYTYLGSGNLPPIVTGIDPQWGDQTGDTAVTITGAGFIAGATVLFDTSPATAVVVVSGTEITAFTPAHGEGLVDVRVTNSDGQYGTLFDGYTYLGVGTFPFITNLDPAEGSPSGGTLVTITGNNLSDTFGQVRFDGKLATVIFWSNTLIRVYSPSGLANTDVSVIATRVDGQATGPLPYHYNDIISSAKTVRYYSRDYLVTELSSLDSIDILSGVNGANGYVSVAVGLFDATGAPIASGNDGLGTGYFIITENDQATLSDIMAESNFDQARILRFRIDMYTPDITADILEQPWVESVSLGYTLVEGQIGVITFADSNTEQYLPNNTDTPIVYNLIATSSLTASDPTFQNIIIGISW